MTTLTHIPPYDRDELARVIELFVEGGSDLSGPRDLDVLLDAIAEAFRVSTGKSYVVMTNPWEDHRKVDAVFGTRVACVDWVRLHYNARGSQRLVFEIDTDTQAPPTDKEYADFDYGNAIDVTFEIMREAREE